MPRGTKLVSRKPRKNVQLVQMVKRKRRGPANRRANPLLKNKLKTTLNYVQEVTIDPGLASIAAHYFRANSIFDPDLTGVGHQPLTRDEYAALYGYYRVLSSRIKVTPVFDSNTAVNPGYWGLYLDTDSTLTYSQGSQVIEDQQRTGKSWGIHNGIQTSAYGKLHKVLKRTFNAKRHLTKEGAVNAVPVGTNPDVGDFSRYFCIWAASIAGNNPGPLKFLVELEYDVEFSDPATVTPS